MPTEVKLVQQPTTRERIAYIKEVFSRAGWKVTPECVRSFGVEKDGKKYAIFFVHVAY